MVKARGHAQDLARARHTQDPSLAEGHPARPYAFSFATAEPLDTAVLQAVPEVPQALAPRGRGATHSENDFVFWISVPILDD